MGREIDDGILPLSSRFSRKPQKDAVWKRNVLGLIKRSNCNYVCQLSARARARSCSRRRGGKKNSKSIAAPLRRSLLRFRVRLRGVCLSRSRSSGSTLLINNSLRSQEKSRAMAT